MNTAIKTMNERYEEYLKDESRLTGRCDSISFPVTEEELADIAKELWHSKIPITVQGARTGIAGSAVPNAGHVMNMERLNKIISARQEEGRYVIAVEPGVRLAQLNEACASGAAACKGYRFMPDPTETTATLGGMFLTNAKGMNVLSHGDMASRVKGIRMLTPDGTFMDIERGQVIFDASGCTLPNGKRIETGGLVSFSGGVKGLMGIHEGADLIDVIAGSEGMLCIVTKLKVIVEPEPSEQWGVLFFFRDMKSALAFSRYIITENKEQRNLEDARLCSVEFFHKTALDMVSDFKDKVTRLKAIPDFPEGSDCAVYVELEGEDADSMETALTVLLEAFVNHGGCEDDTWAGAGASEMEKFKLLRHAAPESVNARIDEIRRNGFWLTKLCTDFTAPMDKLAETLEMYETGIRQSGISGSIFGHISCNHLHVNLMPETGEEYERGKGMIAEWAERITGWGGLIISENGVGKTKRELFLRFSDERRLTAAMAVKNFFDPEGLLNPQNML